MVRKTSFVGCALMLAFVLGASAKTAWLEDMDKALAESKEKNIPIFALFTGSDWCPWCIKLEKEILSTKEFSNFAASNFILFKADFPHSSKQSDKVRRRNEALRDQYKVSGYPTVLILDGEGAVKGKTGYQKGGGAAYVKNCEDLVKRAGYQPKESAAKSSGWLDSYEDAQSEAKDSKLPIFALFTESDGGMTCKKLDSEILSSQEFKDFAEKNLVLFKVDFPRTVKLDPAQKKTNTALRNKFGVMSYPTAVILNADGQVKTKIGYRPGDAASYVKFCEEALTKAGYEVKK
ncbi:MAG: thioredoxin family protein [Kiritimatiellae bacterium]|nr:thioredoxin family protein [Kiritimatiellia bacterium]